MTIPFYIWLHLAGLALVLLSAGGLAFGRDDSRKLLTITHGIGLLVVLVAGFGLLARYQIAWPWPAWVFVKIGVWLAFGASTTLMKRIPALGTPVWWVTWVLFLLAAYLGVSHSV